MLDSLENLLNELLDKKFTICPSKDGKIKLKEPNVSRHKIYGLPPAAVAVRLPTGQEGFLNQDKEPYTQICDYLIFIPDNGKLKIVFCELKSGVDKDEKEKGGKQIVSTIPLLRYFLSAIENHFGKKWKVSQRYAIFGKRSKTGTGIPKRDMRIKKMIDKEIYPHPKNEREKSQKIRIQVILDCMDIPISAIT